MNQNIVTYCQKTKCTMERVHHHCSKCPHIFYPPEHHLEGCAGDNDYHNHQYCSNDFEWDDPSVLYHAHCDVEGCKKTDFHIHCPVNKCKITNFHVHCAKDDCDWAQESSYYYSRPQHIHCDRCPEVKPHNHCKIKKCGLAIMHGREYTHKHCKIKKCQMFLKADTFHSHCRKGGCERTDNHHHCKTCDEVYTNNAEHYHCSECDIMTKHQHCNICDECVQYNTYHQHCIACEKTTKHEHCLKCKGIKTHKHKCGTQVPSTKKTIKVSIKKK